MLVKELFEKQRELDTYIMQKLKDRGTNITNESELLAYRLLALITEVGEISGAEQAMKIDEYADVMHFVLSVGNLSNVKLPYPTIEIKEVCDCLMCNVTYLDALENFLIIFSKFTNGTRVFKYWSTNKNMSERLNKLYVGMFHAFLYIGKSLGFTGEQVEKAYLTKNKINYQRQNEGY